MRLIVDAHVLLWNAEDPARLGNRAREILDDGSSDLVVPTIVLAEVLYALRKKGAGDAWGSLLGAVVTDPRVSVQPFTVEVLRRLPASLEMHDAIICATASLLAETSGDEVAVITNDQQIRESGLVEVAW